jgi:sodium/hydrogen exchanger-like protein 6/7
MSTRTQLTTKYLFSTLAQLSENFIFIYLGLSLFTEVELVYKPIFILVTTMGVCIARWFAVFPLSWLINWVIRARSQYRGSAPDELPISYQVMLFWAGLRGAVGVALSAGLKGEFANSLRTTILVVVVLTVVVFGGTTPRMLDILGIRTGVTDDSVCEDGTDLHDVGFYEYGYHFSGRRSGDMDNDTRRNDRRLPSSFYAEPSQSCSGSDEFSDFDFPPPSNDGFRSSRQSHPGGFTPHTSGSPDASGVSSFSSPLSKMIGAPVDDRARWFQALDDNVLKPVLLHTTPPPPGPVP